MKYVLFSLIFIVLLSGCTVQAAPQCDYSAYTENITRLQVENVKLQAENEYLKQQNSILIHEVSILLNFLEGKQISFR